ncbi:MAG: cation:proton antiporter [Chitinispirillales bacterium]|jgi:Kef-type K+ transport system membrane component KefB/mannitol/fructose-specific phosphotransferase system IIA component (Ntr-type)|nr:cation:proton antiporter [Chitinispirillales bacterium]
MKKKYLILILIPIAAFASAENGESMDGDILHLMARLVLQLGIIVMTARFIGLLFEKTKLPIPSLLFEVLAGIIIGPYVLGSLPLPGFPHGIFPIPSGMGLPVSPELYGLATIASIIMLFSAGLETNLPLLLKFSFVGLLVGLGGVIASFVAGTAVAALFFGLDYHDPIALFLGAICSSSSMAIAARILSEKRKIDSPEGATIFAAEAIDDVANVIILAAVLGFIATTASGGTEAGVFQGPLLVIIKAVLVWFCFTAAGIHFSSPLSKAIKKFKSITYISIFALSLAFILAGVFQMVGLAMIMGAYIVGLSLSKTDLSETVHDEIKVLHGFFVPVFFIVMGMLVNPYAIMSKDVLIFGAVYTAVAMLAKIAGCGIPALFLNFNRLGALRIGVSMAPRGEMAFIVAGVGLSSGIIDQKFFGAAMLMVLVSDIIASPFIPSLFRNDKTGTKKAFPVRETVITHIDLTSSGLTKFLETKTVESFRSEGYYIHSINVGGHNMYHLRKDEALITLHSIKTRLEFESDTQDVMFIKTIVYEALLEINSFISGVKDLIKPENMLKNLAGIEYAVKSDIKNALSPGSIIPFLAAETKQQAIEELVGILHSEGLVKSKNDAITATMTREASMSTGMQHGVAIPHGRTDAVNKITMAVGLSKKGIDYKSIDGEPSTIVVLVLSPKDSESPHIQLLANIAALLNNEEMRAKLLQCRTQEETYNFFKAGLGR